MSQKTLAKPEITGYEIPLTKASLKQLAKPTVSFTELTSVGRLNLLRKKQKLEPLYVYSPPQSSSMMRDYCRCERYFFWSIRLGLKPRTWTAISDSKALRIGSIFHDVVEDVSVNDAPPSQLLQRAEQRLQDKMTPEQKDDDESGIWEDFYKSVAMALAYTTKYPVLPKGHRIERVEQLYCVRDLSLGNPLIGQIDMVSRSSGKYYIPDHKTTGDPPAVLAQVLQWDLQPFFYRRIVEISLKKPVFAAIHNLILKTGIKFCPNSHDKKGILSYFYRVQKWYEEKEVEAKITPASSPMVRHMLWFGKGYPSDFEKKLKTCDRALRRSPVLKAFPKTPDMYTCVKFKRECQYAPLCATDEHIPALAEVLHQRYVQINPLSRYADKMPDESK